MNQEEAEFNELYDKLTRTLDGYPKSLCLGTMGMAASCIFAEIISTEEMAHLIAEWTRMVARSSGVRHEALYTNETGVTH